MQFSRTLCLRKLQEPLGVQMADLLLIRRTDGCALQEHSPLLIRTIGIIDREYDAIGSHGLQGEQKRGISEEAAGRDIEVLQKVLRYCALQMLCHGREHVIDTSEHERNHLPHVPDDDLQGRQAIEHPGLDQPSAGWQIRRNDRDERRQRRLIDHSLPAPTSRPRCQEAARRLTPCERSPGDRYRPHPYPSNESRQDQQASPAVRRRMPHSSFLLDWKRLSSSPL